MSIPIVLTGKDKDGREFREQTRTLIVNRHGAKVVSAYQPASGAEILIENRSLGRAAKASVVWVGEKIDGTETAEIGVQLATDENLWGLEFPPDDSEESVLRGGGPPASKLPVPPSTPGSGDLSAMSPQSEAAAPSTALEPFRKQLEDAAQSALASFGENLTKLSKQAGWSAQLSLQDVAKQLEEKTRSSLKQEFGELLEEAENSRAALLAGLTEARQLQEGWESQTQNLQQKVQAAGRQALQTATEAFSEQLKKDSAVTVAQAELEIRRRQTEVLEQAKGQLDQLVESGTTWLLDDVNKVGEAAITQFRRELETSIEKSGAEVVQSIQGQAQAAADQAMARLQVRVEGMERVARSSTEEAQKQIAEISESLLEGFRSQAKSAIQHLSGQLKEVVQDSEDRAKKELPARLQETSDSLMTTLAKRLEKETEGATRLVTEKRAKEFDTQLRKAAEESVEDSAVQLRKLGQEALELVGAQLKEKESQVVTQAVESFRNKIGKMLSLFQAEGTKSS